MNGRLVAVRLVAGREVREATRRKSFWAVLGVLFVAATAAMVLPDVLSSDETDTFDVVVVGDQAGLGEALTGAEELLDARIEVRIVDDAAIVSPGALLFGKILGVGIIGLATLTAGLIPILVKLALGGDLPEGLAGAVAGGALWFVLGMALYLTVAAALAALVERQEEVGSVVILLATIALTIRLGTLIYARAITRTGRRLKLTEVLRSA
ncbi:MAG: hypothetical protein ACR2JF_07310 [Iamia sp.]